MRVRLPQGAPRKNHESRITNHGPRSRGQGGLQNHPAGCDSSAARQTMNRTPARDRVSKPKPWRRRLVKAEVAGATPVETAKSDCGLRIADGGPPQSEIRNPQSAIPLPCRLAGRMRCSDHRDGGSTPPEASIRFVAHGGPWASRRPGVPVASHAETVKGGVQFSGAAPTTLPRAHRPTAGCRPRTAAIGVQIPVGPPSPSGRVGQRQTVIPTRSRRWFDSSRAHPRSASGRASEWDRRQAVTLLSLD